MFPILIFYFLLFCFYSSASAAPAMLICEVRDEKSVLTKKTFVWDAGAGVFDGHHIGDIWQEGDARIALRNTDTSVIREVTKIAADGRKTVHSISVDDYGYYTESVNSKIIVHGECKKARSENVYDVPEAARSHSGNDSYSANTMAPPAQDLRVNSAVVKLTAAVAILRGMKPKDDPERKNLDDLQAALQAAIGELTEKGLPP